jgi:uncharacterized membrane protein YkvI
MARAMFNKYLLPGLVFQSVVIAGGYGTGREIVEFFLRLGPWTGLVAMMVSMIIWSAVAAVTYEFARVTRTYDYRRFFQQLIGPLWIVFEVCLMALLAIIGAVIGAAAGSILQETFGLPYAAGVAGIMAAVAFLAFKGSRTIERVFAAWSAVLYAVYVTMFVWVYLRFGPEIQQTLANDAPATGWFVAGLSYAGYNVVLAPMILFTIRHIETRREAIGAGLLTGPISMIPGVLFYLAMTGLYPAVVERPVPANYVLEMLGSRTFQIVFQIMLFGTLIESGAGLIHSVNERVDHFVRERGGTMPSWARATAALGFLAFASLLARLGLVELIAKGYGTLTWAFVALFVIPVLTVGVWTVWRAPREPLRTAAHR